MHFISKYLKKILHSLVLVSNTFQVLSKVGTIFCLVFYLFYLYYKSVQLVLKNAKKSLTDFQKKLFFFKNIHVLLHAINNKKQEKKLFTKIAYG